MEDLLCTLVPELKLHAPPVAAIGKASLCRLVIDTDKHFSVGTSDLAACAAAAGRPGRYAL